MHNKPDTLKECCRKSGHQC